MLLKEKNANISLPFYERQRFIKSSKTPLLFTIYEKEKEEKEKEEEKEEEIYISIFRKPYLFCSNSQVFFIK